MNNELVKNIDVTGSAGQAAIAPTPAIPARTVYETQMVCEFVPTNSLPGANTAAPGSLDGIIAPAYVYQCAPKTVAVNYPAVPGTPGQPYIPSTLQNDYHLGWNAGARSIQWFERNGKVTFQAPAAVVGAIAGLKVLDGTPVDHHGQSIEWGFSLARGNARIRELGADVASVGTFTDTTVFGIERHRDTIIYTMDGVEKRRISGASPAPSALQADLYSGGDSVGAPTIEALLNDDPGTVYGIVGAQLPALVGFVVTGHGFVSGALPRITTVVASGTGTISHGFVAARLPMIQSASYGHNVNAGQLNATLPPVFALVAGKAYSAISMHLPRVLGDVESGQAQPAYGVISGRLPPMFGLVDALAGAAGSIDGSLKSVAALMADRPYGVVHAALPALQTVALSVEGNTNASLGSFAGARASADAAVLLLVAINSSGHVASAMTVTVETLVTMLAQAGASFSVGAIADYVVNLKSIGSFSAMLGLPEDDSEVWCLNLDGLGTTRYSNYPFNSFGRIGDRYLGAMNGGVFELDADDDAGAPIRSVIGFGDLDFGKRERKTVSECYVGMSGAGNLFLKVVAEGREYVYSTRSHSDNLRQERVTLGKGLRANYLTLELYNADGADFELDTVAFTVVDLSRRI